MNALERLNYEEYARQYKEMFGIDPIALGLSLAEITRGLKDQNKEIERIRWIDLEDEKEAMRQRGIPI